MSSESIEEKNNLIIAAAVALTGLASMRSRNRGAESSAKAAFDLCAENRDLPKSICRRIAMSFNADGQPGSTLRTGRDRRLIRLFVELRTLESRLCSTRSSVVCDQKEKRGFFALNTTPLAFTIAAITFLIIAVAAVAGLPIVLKHLPLHEVLEWAIDIARWLILRSALFSWYAAKLGSDNEMYGSLGAVTGFTTWLWISAAVILLGGEVNAEMEHHTLQGSNAAGEALY